MVPLGDEAQVQLISVLSEIILIQDRCTVYVKRTLGSEIILDSLDKTPR
jgi:hypothetical protein